MKCALTCLAAACTAILLSSCSGAGGHGSSLVKTVQQHRQPNHNGGLRIDAAFDNHDLVAIDMNGQQFAIRSRLTDLDQFPCRRCHTVPLPQMKHDGKDGKARAHWSLKLKHADEQMMSCSTCHFEADLNQLRTLTNQPVPMDASHQVCAQCHFGQAADWAGGSHGKRVGGWAPPRVAKTCVECHNPHGPAWDQRFPARAAKREDKPGHE